MNGVIKVVILVDAYGASSVILTSQCNLPSCALFQKNGRFYSKYRPKNEKIEHINFKLIYNNNNV